MIHPALKGKKMVFDVKDRPELARAICDRLVALGAGDYREYFAGKSISNVTYNHYENMAAYGTTHYECLGYKLHTLSDLYDLKPSPLQLEVGKWYRDRDGKLHGPIQESNHNWALEFNDGNESWTREGVFDPEGSGSPMDLIEELTTLPITLADGTTVEIPVAEHERSRGVK